MKDEETGGSDFLVNSTEVSSFLSEWIEVMAHALIFVVFIIVFVFRLMSVKGPSMRETLHDGDRVLVWLYGYEPHDGDVVVVKPTGKINVPIVKRIIATSGERLHIDFNTSRVYVNGKLRDEPYIKDKDFGPEDAEIPEVIPEGKCFVMGDNRNNSTDSRSADIGLIDYSKIHGVVKYVFFPFYRIKSVPNELHEVEQ